MQRQEEMQFQLPSVYWPWRTACQGGHRQGWLQGRYHDSHALERQKGLVGMGCGRGRAELYCREVTETAAAALNPYLGPWRTVSGHSWGLRRHPRHLDMPSRHRHLAGLWTVDLAARDALPRFWQTDGEPVKMIRWLKHWLFWWVGWWWLSYNKDYHKKTCLNKSHH